MCSSRKYPYPPQKVCCVFEVTRPPPPPPSCLLMCSIVEPPVRVTPLGTEKVSA